MPTTRPQEGFNSTGGKFEIDGENIVTAFLQHYAASFTTGLASGKVAETLIQGTLPEIGLPLAAISSLIQGGVEYFLNTKPQDSFKAGDVCVFQAGYWKETNSERAALGSMFQDQSEIEGLNMIQRFDICVVRRPVPNKGDDMYEVFDFAHRELRDVHASRMRKEPQDSPLTNYDVVNTLRKKYLVEKPKSAERVFQDGDYVFVRNLDFSGTVAEVTRDFIFVRDSETGTDTKIPRVNWHYLMTAAEVEATKITPKHGRSDLRQFTLCFYPMAGKLRPVVITELKGLKAVVRAFHVQTPFEVDTSELIKASSTYKNKIQQNPEYTIFMDMVRKTPAHDNIPLVTKDTSQLAFDIPVLKRDTAEELDLTRGDEEESQSDGDSNRGFSESLPATVAYGTPVQLPELELPERRTAELPERRTVGEVSGFADPEKDNTTTFVLIAGGVLAGVLLFMK